VTRRTIDELLADARVRLARLDPDAAQLALASGATIIDIRSEAQIAADAAIPGALVISRNTLEWRLDSDCPHWHVDAPALDEHLILVCDEGYQSSLAAATLQELGFARATDLDGGFQAWRAGGLPVDAGPRLH
jgi:rhodanese-related sulfurtransferase